MRLIDADVIPYLYPVDDDGNDGDGMTLKSTIDEIPTVKAIPIEVVEQMRDYFELLAHFNGTVKVKAAYVSNMLDKAIKEQND